MFIPIVLIIVAIVLAKSGVGDGAVAIIIAAICGLTTGVASSFAATPFIGIPIGIFVAYQILKFML